MDNEPDATISREPQRFWIQLDQGLIQAGRGLPGTHILCSWKDPSPLIGLKYVGLTAWDTYNSYRNIAVHPTVTAGQRQVRTCCFWCSLPALLSLTMTVLQNLCLADSCLDLHPSTTGGLPACSLCLQQEFQLAAEPDLVPTLMRQCSNVIMDSLSPENVCFNLLAAEALAPALEELQERLLTYLAQHLSAVVGCDLQGFVELPSSCLIQVLLCPSLVSTYQLEQLLLKLYSYAPMQTVLFYSRRPFPLSWNMMQADVIGKS